MTREKNLPPGCLRESLQQILLACVHEAHKEPPMEGLLCLIGESLERIEVQIGRSC